MTPKVAYTRYCGAGKNGKVISQPKLIAYNSNLNMVKERKPGFGFCANEVDRVRDQLYEEAKRTCEKLGTGLFLPDLSIDFCQGKRERSST